MNQDSAFFIGKTHNVCQDYAIHGANYDDGFAIVSDGCSSSPNSDFGSRFLAVGARNALAGDMETPDKLVTEALSNARYYGDAMKFHYSHLDATLLVAHHHDRKINVLATGDGVIVTKDKDGVIIIREITYAGGAPIYMNYFSDDARMAELLKTFDCKKTIRTTIVYKDGEEDADTVSTSLFESHQFDIDQYDLVAVMTDGVSSFQKPVITSTSKTYDRIGTVPIVRKLMDVKSYAGQFVERTCKAFLRDCQKNGIIHGDDLSVGMIYTGK